MSWTKCPYVVRNRHGKFVIEDTNVWPSDIVRLRHNGANWLAITFNVPTKAVESIVRYYEENSASIDAAGI